LDPLTHVLLGASLGYATFGRKLGRATAWVGGLAAFIPDADVFIRSKSDPLLAIEYHRHFTHALPFAPAGAALVASIAWLAPSRRNQFLPFWACATLAYLSHCLLDAATSYGTQLLWPFSDLRFGWDVISIIDPLFTLILVVALIWALIRQHTRVASIGLVLALMYVGFGTYQHARAMKAQSTLAEARGHLRVASEVMPTVGNLVVWRSLYRHGSEIQSDRIRVGWFSATQVREGRALPVVEAQDLKPSEKARDAHRSFERFAWFSDGWVARSPGDASILGDMRYSLSTEAFDPIWGIRFTPPEEPTEVVWINRTREREIKPRELWDEIAGNDARFRPLNPNR
jgi:inner membrane protein